MGACASSQPTKPDSKPANAWPVGAFAPGGLPDKPAQHGLQPSSGIPGYPTSSEGMKFGYPTAADPGPGLSPQHHQQSQIPSAPAFSATPSMPTQRAAAPGSPPSSLPHTNSMPTQSLGNGYPTIPFGADSKAPASTSQYPQIHHRPPAAVGHTTSQATGYP